MFVGGWALVWVWVSPPPPPNSIYPVLCTSQSCPSTSSTTSELDSFKLARSNHQAAITSNSWNSCSGFTFRTASTPDSLCSLFSAFLSPTALIPWEIVLWVAHVNLASLSTQGPFLSRVARILCLWGFSMSFRMKMLLCFFHRVK